MASSPAPGAPGTPAPRTGSTDGFTPARSPAFTVGGIDAAPTSMPAPGSMSSPASMPAPVAPPAPVVPMRPPAPSSTEGGGQSFRYRDAHLDRAVVLPTAETHPAGTWTLSSYELLVLQVGYAFSDDAQVSFTFLPLVGRDEPLVPLDVSVKGVLLREGPVRVAVLGSATGLLGFEEGEVFFGRAGGVTQLCFDDGCQSSANVSSNLALGGPALVLLNGLGFILRTSDHVALLAETQVLHPIGRAASQANGMGLSFGVRFSGRKLGLDIALFAPFSVSEDLPPVIPFLAGTYRFLP